MKILVVYPYIPYPLDRGTYQRTFHLLLELAQTHRVTLVALAENGEGIEHKPLFESFCEEVEFIPFQHAPWPKLFPKRLLNPLPTSISHWSLPEVEQRLRSFLQHRSFDAVHVCDIVMAQYFLQKPCPLVVDRSRVDLQFQLAEHSRLQLPLRSRALRWEGYGKLWLYERRVADRADLQIVCGPDDEQFVRRWIKRQTPVEVLVNGVNLDYFSAAALEEPRASQPTLLFCGTMDYSPNIDALRWYFGEMHERLRRAYPELRVLIVGKSPTPEVQSYGQHPGVTVTGSVPDVRPYYRQAWLQIVPLRIGGGTRLKIVESMAIQTPVVSTRIGAQGLDLVHNSDILLADDTESFLRETGRALSDSRLREQIEIAGLKTAQSRFSWKTIGARLNRIYADRFSAREQRFQPPHLA